MATILPFIPRSAGNPRPAPPGGSAAIMFFTGVRYERGVVADQDAPAQRDRSSLRRPRRRGVDK
ncbi:MAG: hypothetical protein AB7I79_07370 [Rhizobiaceae bacterium]